MALKNFQSSTITFLDRTDERILEVYIQSNHPTVQIKNSNTGEYTPNWNITHLELNADVFVNSTEITTDSQTTINWYTKTGGVETLIGTGNLLTVSANVLDTNPIITYVCRAEYQGLNAFSQISFTRADTGKNGVDATAPRIVAQYSGDGASGWSDSFAASDRYIRFSYDSGKTWAPPIKIVGEDGTSVSLSGTAYYNGILIDEHIGTAVPLYSDETWEPSKKITTAKNGDSYIVQGYLCVYNATIGGFVCSGFIQGPEGKDGESSYLYIMYAKDADGTNMSAYPAGMPYVGFAVTASPHAPTIPQAYIWNKFVGEDAKYITLSGSAQVFKVDKEGKVTPNNIIVTAQEENTTITSWAYSINGGSSFVGTAPNGVYVNGNTVAILGTEMKDDSIVLRATDGIHSDVFTVYKASDGKDGLEGKPGEKASFAFLTNENVSFAANAKGEAYGTFILSNVVAYKGTEKVKPVLGTILNVGLPKGMTIGVDEESSALTDQEIVLVLNIANGSNLGTASSTSGTIMIPVISPISTNLELSWSKINTGATGAGINSVTVDYGVSIAPSAQPTEWTQTIPVVAEGQYLWTRTITDYTDPEIVDTVTYTYAKQGSTGEPGKVGSSVTVSSIQYQEGTSPTVTPTGTWSDAIVEDG